MRSEHNAGVVIVHGGAGSFANERVLPATAGCRAAVRAGIARLAAGDAAVDAAIEGVRVLEEDPTFNAGVGAVLTRAGTVEMDAAVMVGDGLRFGAVAAMPNIRNPIEVARAVMEAGEHGLLCGHGAWEFARGLGFQPTAADQLIIPVRRRDLDDEAQRRMDSGRARGRSPDPGTVGACVVDARGRTAVATSTGGMTYKRIGRIGDTPLPGCGSYADDGAGAASATGDGEGIMRVTMTRHCVEAMRAGATASAAAWAAVAELERVAARAGVICCDVHGRIGVAHNTTRMAWAAAVVGPDGRAERMISDIALAPGTDVMALVLAQPALER